jgi:hypothetical protein
MRGQSRCASRSTVSSNSAYVQSVLPQRMASLFGNLSRVLRNRSPKVWREISVFSHDSLGFLAGADDRDDLEL